MTLPNQIEARTPVRGEQAFVYGLKARAQRHHCLGYGTFAVDVSALGGLRKEYSHAVRPITYLPIYVKATALALQRNPEANAILFKKWISYEIVRFGNVDVNLPISRQINGRVFTFIATIRDAASKSLAQIQEEIRAHQECAPEQSFAIERIRRFDALPFWAARLVHWRMARSPAFYIKNVGTCGVTFLEQQGFERFFPIAPTSVVFGIGCVAREPVVHGEEIVIGRSLKCTLMVDNFVVSGMTGLKLARDFTGLLESGAVMREVARPAEARP
jgi:pyruvate/2-oxoglutarate dehydrogenase complex dihydrolipoamide acyltransferase (E2) component